ncbi:MDR family NADP-dependent oxidoreductase [Streptomyces boncukensis]|uniref:NADP-dependent oxidoreductase n=1 Tax=Streptomyces boncukensis TaxID=2711219 RepID=A0A6G4X8Y9_9ACTN|nr:NADP-dependent oxidoreductase [Streptomyces boncukensis]NGO73307.1 NADP-dependent oxidoreductase [Streptomyces boncukensis]
MTADTPHLHREVHLTERPDGDLAPGHLGVVDVPVPVPGPGQILVRNTLMSVTAVMRSLMREGDAARTVMPGYGVGEPLWGPALGEVVSGVPGGPRAGDLVEHYRGWREYAVLGADAARPVPTTGASAFPDPAAHLSQGFTAWLGVVRGAEVRAGDTVFVSGAAGGVGSLTGPIARLRGARRVIGSTGSERKAEALVRELGYDAAVVRGAGPIEEQLRAAAPDGLDAVVDNVGGEQLEAALALAREGARVGVVGALAGQLSAAGTGHTRVNTFELITRAVTVRGVRTLDVEADLPVWQREFAAALRGGELPFPHTRLRGIEQAPRALCELLEGRHIGAVLVELS